MENEKMARLLDYVREYGDTSKTYSIKKYVNNVLERKHLYDCFSTVYCRLH
jgi:hypothetical protein